VTLNIINLYGAIQLSFGGCYDGMVFGQLRSNCPRKKRITVLRLLCNIVFDLMRSELEERRREYEG
jgi:hypothetical protein